MAEDKDDKKDQDKKSDGSDPSMTAILGAIGKMAEGFSNMDKLVRAMGDRLAKVEEGGTLKAAAKSEDIDLETMGNTELANHIAQTVLASIKDTVMKPLEDQIKSVGGRVGSMSVRDEIDKIKTSHKDFDEWRSEVSEQIKANGQLSIEDALTLARAKNPDKSKELDAKYNPAKPEPFDASKGFFGFGPSASVDAKADKMDAKQAAETAWNETMANLPVVTQ